MPTAQNLQAAGVHQNCLKSQPLMILTLYACLKSVILNYNSNNNPTGCLSKAAPRVLDACPPAS